jgi:hypothetical protein
MCEVVTQRHRQVQARARSSAVAMSEPLPKHSFIVTTCKRRLPWARRDRLRLADR